MTIDWEYLWKKKAKNRKSRVNLRVNNKVEDLNALGDFLSQIMEKCDHESISEEDQNLSLSRLQEKFKHSFIIKKPLPKPNQIIIDICSEICDNIFSNNIFDEDSLKVIDVEENEINTLYFIKNPVKYIIGLYFQHIKMLEYFKDSIKRFYLKNEDSKIPSQRSYFFSFVLIMIQEIFQELKPWKRSFVFYCFFEHKLNLIRRKKIYESNNYEMFNSYFLYQLWRQVKELISLDKRSMFYYIIERVNPTNDNPKLLEYWNKLKKEYGEAVIKYERDQRKIEEEIEMKYWNLSKERFELKKKFARNMYDWKKPDAYKLETLNSIEIPELNKEERTKYDIFKIECNEFVGKIGTKDIEKNITENLYLLFHGKWKSVLSHSIYSWEMEIDHGKTHEFNDKPLIPEMYIDLEYLFYFIENEEGILYFSMDKLNWNKYIIEPKKRPYYNRIKKLRRFRIPN